MRQDVDVPLVRLLALAARGRQREIPVTNFDEPGLGTLPLDVLVKRRADRILRCRPAPCQSPRSVISASSSTTFIGFFVVFRTSYAASRMFIARLLQSSSSCKGPNIECFVSLSSTWTTYSSGLIIFSIISTSSEVQAYRLYNNLSVHVFE